MSIIIISNLCLEPHPKTAIGSKYLLFAFHVDNVLDDCRGYFFKLLGDRVARFLIEFLIRTGSFK